MQSQKQRKLIWFLEVLLLPLTLSGIMYSQQREEQARCLPCWGQSSRQLRGTRNLEGICSETNSAGQPGEGTDTSSTVPFCRDRPSPALPTYRTAVEGGSDVGVVVVGHLLVVGAQEADGLVVAVGGGVMPGDGLVAVVRDVLVG